MKKTSTLISSVNLKETGNGNNKHMFSELRHHTGEGCRHRAWVGTSGCRHQSTGWSMTTSAISSVCCYWPQYRWRCCQVFTVTPSKNTV